MGNEAGYQVVVLGLVVVLLCRLALPRTGLTGQFVFSLPWLVSLLAAGFVPSLREAVTLEAAVVVVGIHLAFFLGSAAVRPRHRRAEAVTVPIRSVLVLFWLTAIIGCLGAGMNLGASGITYLSDPGQLVAVRDQVFRGGTVFAVGQRAMAAFLYPAAVMGGVAFVFSRPGAIRWLYLSAPIAGLLTSSLAIGGRGPVLIGVLLVVWPPLIVWGKRRIRRADTFVGVAAVAGLLMYFSFVAQNRPGTSSGAYSIYSSFVGCVPAFAQWLRAQDSIPVVRVDLTGIAMVREISRLSGSSVSRTIDQTVVFTAHRFNVYTQVAEHLQYFGWLGAFLLSGCLGIASAVLEGLPLKPAVLAFRAWLYAYLAWSLFSDLSFLIVGWTLCVPVVLMSAFVRRAGRSARATLGRQPLTTLPSRLRAGRQAPVGALPNRIS